jgi:hypothetical protein
MKLSQIEPELLPIDKLSHLKFQVEAKETFEKIIESLNKRKVFLKELLSVTIDPSHTLSMYEQNERELLLIKTDMAIWPAYLLIAEAVHVSFVVKRWRVILVSILVS